MKKKECWKREEERNRKGKLKKYQGKEEMNEEL